jgi:tRNA pseudouridine32 synthase/23S rRNA pseudouridine746 synthase
MYHLINENEDFLVVNKQPEVSIHDEDNAADVLNKNNKGLIKQLRIDFNNNAIAPVHRLDKSTSGLLICSKNSQAASVLSQAFQHRQVEKYYLAISENKPSKKQGLITGDMLRTRNGCWKLSKAKTNPAATQFFSYSLNAINNSRGRLFVLKPHTGKTHQLRVALKTIDATILGDRRYGKVKKIDVTAAKQLSSNTLADHKTNKLSLDVTTNDTEDVNKIKNVPAYTERMHLHAYVLRFYYKDRPYCYCVLPSGGEFTDELNHYIKSTLSEPWALEWPAFAKSNKTNSSNNKNIETNNNKSKIKEYKALDSSHKCN